MARRPPARHVPSSIDKLGSALVAEVNRLRIDEGYTIDEIVAHLGEMGERVSRSAVGRHVRSLPEIAQQMRQSRELAESLAREMGDKPEDKLAELNIEILHGEVMRMLMSVERDAGDENSPAFDTKDLMQLSKTIQSLAAARKTDVERVVKIRAEAAAQAKREEQQRIATAVKKAGGAGGLSADAVSRINAIVLGEG